MSNESLKCLIYLFYLGTLLEEWIEVYSEHTIGQRLRRLGGEKYFKDKIKKLFQVKFLYDTDVVNLEAWKGDVASLSQREYTVSSK